MKLDPNEYTRIAHRSRPVLVSLARRLEVVGEGMSDREALEVLHDLTAAILQQPEEA